MKDRKREDVKFNSFKFIDSIPKDDKKDGVIIVGRGPSIDNLNLEVFNEQQKYDICTITDAIKITTNPKFAFNYHDQGYRRIQKHIDKPKYFVVPIKMIQDIYLRKWDDTYSKLRGMKSVRLFIGRNRKDLRTFKNPDFPLQVDDNLLYNRHGSIVGVMHFLLGYMDYKKIFYIGFDGGQDYGKLVHSNRKETKKIGAEIDYQRSWETVLTMLTHYPDVRFEPLTQFLLRGNKKQD